MPPCVSSQPVSDVVVVLPCVPAIDHRLRIPQEMIANRFRQRAVAQLSIEHRLELDIPARDRVADDHQIQRAGDVLGSVALENRNPFAPRKSLIGG